MPATELRERIGGEWTERFDGWWVGISLDQLRATAAAMLEGGARFSALVAALGLNGSFRLSWHWDVVGTLLSVESTLAAGAELPTIADIYPGADWAERETRDYFAIAFSGRPSTTPLMLREQDAPGVLLLQPGEHL